jgi:hypothetical protein
MLRAFFLAGCIALSAVPFSGANAGYVGGNKLYDICTGADLSLCLGFILGSTDAFLLRRQLDGKTDCISDEITGRQINDIVVEHLRKAPEKRHWDASVLVWNSIREAFPACNN